MALVWVFLKSISILLIMTFFQESVGTTFFNLPTYLQPFSGPHHF